MLANNTANTGTLGESIAKKYLKEKGYKICFENINFSNQEIDIIAKKQNYYYIIEVKTSSEKSTSEPEDYINSKKLSNLKKAAYLFSKKNKINFDLIFFDLIAIKLVSSLRKAELKHYKNIC